MTPKKNNSYCHYPFFQLALKQWEKGHGIITAAPCCNALRPSNDFDALKIKEKLQNAPVPLTPKEIFFGSEMKELRNDMMQGKKNPACQVCWDMEMRSGDASSYRLMSDKPDDFDLEDINLSGLDLAFEEDCNLRCRMCSPGLSNKLRVDLKFFRENELKIDSWGSGVNDFEPNYDPDSENQTYNFDNESVQWKNILDNIHELRTIKATGGETLLSESFNQFLDVAIETGNAKNITLEFHTNATVFTSKMMYKLNFFKKINPTFSIDTANEKSYEYIRYPMSWKMLEKSVYKFIDNIDNEKVDIIHINSVMSAMTAFDYRELCDWVKQIGRICDTNMHLWVDELWPKEKAINITYLPHQMLSQLRNEYYLLDEQYNIWKKGRNMFFSIKHVINLIDEVLSKEENTQREKMLYEIRAFDASRKQDYHDFLHPWIIEFLDEESYD